MMSELLMHDDLVPPRTRAALRAVKDGPASARAALLESAARIVYAETELDCADVRELLDLPGDCDGA